MINPRAGLTIGAVAVAGALATVGTAVAGASTHAVPSDTHHAEAVPRTLIGRKITAQPQTSDPGTVLTGKDITYPRVFSSSADGLAIGGDKLGNQYAALTTDGGVTWTVGSPALFTATADAPNGVSAVATAGTKIDMVYGPESIDVTNNGGVTWYRVYPDGFVTSVVQGLQGILADVQITGDNGKVLATDEYVSTNAGKAWKLESVLGG